MTNINSFEMTNNFNSSHPTVLSLHGFRQGLIALKDDRTTYIRSANVRNAYQKLCEFILADDSFANNEEDSSTETTSEQKECNKQRIPSDSSLLFAPPPPISRQFGS
jgi:hypothetical protein